MSSSSSPTRARDSRRMRLLWIVVLLLALGVSVRLLTWTIATDSTPSDADAATAAGEQERWSALVQALEDEVEARRELARELAELREALADAGLLGAQRDVEDSPPEELALHPELDPMYPDAAAEMGRRPGFDVEALVGAGFDPARAAALRERWEEHELEKLYLRDQAAREGWMMSSRHRNEQIALADRLREEIGEEAYAAMLYGQGQPNTVEVTDVLARSPAQDAGLEPGDAIVRYDGVRVYRPNGLRLATSAGEPGEFVAVEVIRDGRPVTLRARRGPLGVLLRGATRPPTP